ncbi:MAG: magnesium/cobalt transporter CorA [Balneolaceae bacterium]|nr:magnesium/cobalt transporter CorA [Balneolaceae bacterium]
MYKKAGLAPGTLLYTGEHTDNPVVVNAIQYNPESFIEEEITNADGVYSAIRGDKVNWFNVTGLHNTEIIAKIGSQFSINNLALEDALNTSELPKTEEFEHQLFITLKMIKTNGTKIETEHISLVLGDHYLLGLQEKPGDVFDGVRNRLRIAYGKFRSRGHDYLLYALLDAIVDNYFLVLDEFTGNIDQLEQSIFKDNDKNTLNEINELKKELIQLRKYMVPLDLAIQHITKHESEFISDEISHFFEDLKNHLNQIVTQLNDHRDALKTLTDLHISLLSNEMNQVMKVLTIVSAIFIPLTFLAGIYGMNFQHMPELQYPWAYPTLLGLMLITTLGLVAFFKHKKWL